MALLGNYTYFGVTSATLGSATGWVMVPLCGVAGGFFGGVFSRILVEFGRGCRARWAGRFSAHRTLFALAAAWPWRCAGSGRTAPSSVPATAM